MASSRTADRSATFTIAALDHNDVEINATAASWAMLDERGREITTGDASLFNAGDSEVVFTIDASHMSLPPAATCQGRELVVTLETSDGAVEVRSFFILVAAQALRVMTNSFLTYAEALALRGSFGPVLDGWDAMQDQAARSSAMSDAFERLLRLSFRVSNFDPMTQASTIAAYGSGTDMPFGYKRRIRLRTLTVDEFDSLPDGFRRALKRAQLLEADVILGGDAVGRKRQEGVISETIGESSAFFSAKPYLNLPVSRRAFDELRRFVVLEIRAARG